MGLIDLFQKTRETSMEMKPQEDEAAKVVTCKGCGAELKAYAYGKNLYVCPHCGRYGRLLARTRILDARGLGTLALQTSADDPLLLRDVPKVEMVQVEISNLIFHDIQGAIDADPTS